MKVQDHDLSPGPDSEIGYSSRPVVRSIEYGYGLGAEVGWQFLLNGTTT